ncbi:MAG: P-type conjugative transfer ATPase TrbB [Candidatus Omnitrophica bacterium]|nr:P-type conjugative transfer ATPase TrbB [Candidatus Omnitrophota bacterium]MDE2222026.1 P-type conjugative transfer ATPase TrbB [Candidatus Omnitrophota bacterium]
MKLDLGEHVLSALLDEEVYEVLLNPDGKLWVDGYRGKRRYGSMAASAAQNLINTIASVSNETVTHRNPSFSGELWIEMEGEFKLFRFQAFIPPVVAYPAFAIRKRAGRTIALEQFVRDEILNPLQGKIIKDFVERRKSIIVIGGTQSGKTTLCNAILDCVAKVHPDDRVVLIEDTQELQCNVEDCVALRSSPLRSMNDLIFDSMRMRPDRIVIGEVRGKEAYSLIKAWNTGHPGGISTLHANSTLSGLLRLEQLILEAGVPALPEAVAEAVNLLVFIQKTNKAKKGRQVTDMLELKGYDKTHGYLTAAPA